MWGTSYSINEWEDNHLQPERRVNIIVSPTTWGTHWKSYWILKNTKHMWETIKRNTAYSTHNNRFGVGEASAMELRSPIAHGKLWRFRAGQRSLIETWSDGTWMKQRSWEFPGTDGEDWDHDEHSWSDGRFLLHIVDASSFIVSCAVLCPCRSGVVASRNMTMAASMTMKMLIVMMLLMITTKMIAPASSSISHLSPVQCQGCFQGCLSKWERCPGCRDRGMWWLDGGNSFWEKMKQQMQNRNCLSST